MAKNPIEERFVPSLENIYKRLIDLERTAQIPFGISFGTFQLSSGTATVETTRVSANSIILMTHQVVSGTRGILAVGTIIPGESFSVGTGTTTDNGTIGYVIIEPGPIVEANLS